MAKRKVSKRKPKLSSTLTTKRALQKHIQEHVKLLNEQKVSTKEDIKNVLKAFLGVGLVVATVMLIGSLI